jgi:hypothetical protein
VGVDECTNEGLCDGVVVWWTKSGLFLRRKKKKVCEGLDVGNKRECGIKNHTRSGQKGYIFEKKIMQTKEEQSEESLEISSHVGFGVAKG